MFEMVVYSPYDSDQSTSNIKSKHLLQMSGAIETPCKRLRLSIDKDLLSGEQDIIDQDKNQDYFSSDMSDSDGDIEATQMMNLEFKNYLKEDSGQLAKTPNPADFVNILENSNLVYSEKEAGYSNYNDSNDIVINPTQFSNININRSLFAPNIKRQQELDKNSNPSENLIIPNQDPKKKSVNFPKIETFLIKETQLSNSSISKLNFIEETQMIPNIHSQNLSGSVMGDLNKEISQTGKAKKDQKNKFSKEKSIIDKLSGKEESNFHKTNDKSKSNENIQKTALKVTRMNNIPDYIEDPSFENEDSPIYLNNKRKKSDKRFPRKWTTEKNKRFMSPLDTEINIPSSLNNLLRISKGHEHLERDPNTFELKIGPLTTSISISNIKKQKTRLSTGREKTKKVTRKLFSINSSSKSSVSESFESSRINDSTETVQSDKHLIETPSSELPIDEYQFQDNVSLSSTPTQINTSTPKHTGSRLQSVNYRTSLCDVSITPTLVSKQTDEKEASLSKWVWFSLQGVNTMYYPVYSNNVNLENSPFKLRSPLSKESPSLRRLITSGAFYLFSSEGTITKLKTPSYSSQFKQIKSGDRVWAVRERRRKAETGQIVDITCVEPSMNKLLNLNIPKRKMRKTFPSIRVKFDKDDVEQDIPVYKIHSTNTMLGWIITPQRISSDFSGNKANSRCRVSGLRDRRNLKENDSSTPSKDQSSQQKNHTLNLPANDQLFAGMNFLVTLSPLFKSARNNSTSGSLGALFSFKDSGDTGIDRKGLEEFIKKFGGEIISNIPNVHKNLDQYMQNTFILSDSPSATFKYLYGLANGIPLVSILWVFECIKNNQMFDPHSFLLANGWSYALNTACASRHVHQFMKGTTVLVLGSPGFNRNWKILLDSVGARVFFLSNDDGRQLLLRKRQCDFILSEFQVDIMLQSRISLEYSREYSRSDGQVGNSEISERSFDGKAPFYVSSQWAKQCLINQRILGHDLHPLFSSFTKKKSNGLRSLIRQLN
ncbi:hypothetical protein BB560_001952 [Smittium megazygosporum]|uniref:BRCT domain-containing protein n=1 Tax=Smittium megazygosporum TaxID=133381 RepID=A0A2T9ZG50_9FUNG|nr:hypothetical protein BB560_001952 [Smittium megazygosporum]